MYYSIGVLNDLDPVVLGVLEHLDNVIAETKDLKTKEQAVELAREILREKECVEDEDSF